MKYLLLSVFLVSLLSSCKYDSTKEIQYEIYSNILDKEFGHFPQEITFIVGVNDSVKDFKDELETLIYSIQNNNHFFKEYCQEDTAFKNFLLAIKTIDTQKEIMNLHKLRSKIKIKINLERLIKSESLHHTINFSKILFNKNQDKAILFVTKSSSGSWVFVELINKKWTVKHDILSWTI